MPQMIALYNGMGGAAAGAIAPIELLHYQETPLIIRSLAILGAIIGTLSFSGSIIAFAKLQEFIKASGFTFSLKWLNLVILLSHFRLGAHDFNLCLHYIMLLIPIFCIFSYIP